MDLPTIVSSSKQSTEAVESDGETEIERELRETIEGKLLRTQLAECVLCVFYSQKLSRPIFTKLSHKLAFGSTKRFYKSEIENSMFGSKYSLFTLTFIIELCDYIR